MGSEGYGRTVLLRSSSLSDCNCMNIKESSYGSDGHTFISGAGPEARKANDANPIGLSGEVRIGTLAPWGICGALLVKLTPRKTYEVLGCVGGRRVADDDLGSVGVEGADTRKDDTGCNVKVRH